MRVRHILFPTDFSNLALAAEDYVRIFAHSFGALVSILHAIDYPPYLYEMPPASFMETTGMDTEEKHARETIENVLPGLAAERVVQVGEPARVIKEFAETNSVDLIMMPTHGYGLFRRALIGSVTAKTLHDVQCNVWTMAHKETHAPVPDTIPSRIVCAIDVAPESVEVIKSAAQVAGRFGARLWLAHVVGHAMSVRDEYLDDRSPLALDLQKYYIDFAREKIANFQREAGTNFDVSVDVGAVSAVLAEMARKLQANLMITGRGVSEDLLGSVRSHGYPIIQESPCPVLRV
jgi:nucleotide-binding universal stress UspA family protein